MPVTVKYEVKKPFKYFDEKKKIGDEFIPKGGKWDDYLLSDDSPFVRRVEYTPAPKEVKEKWQENELPLED
jgi:hypothetical protein